MVRRGLRLEVKMEGQVNAVSMFLSTAPCVSVLRWWKRQEAMLSVFAYLSFHFDVPWTAHHPVAPNCQPKHDCQPPPPMHHDAPKLRWTALGCTRMRRQHLIQTALAPETASGGG